MYANNYQIYLSTSIEDASLAVSKFTRCVADINTSLSVNRLGQNASKTQLMWLGSTQLLNRITCMDISVLGTHVIVTESAHDLRVVIDRKLSLAALMTAVYRAGYNQLHHFRPVIRSLSVHATKTLVQAFISCRLDYCNSLLQQLHWLPVHQRVTFKVLVLVYQSLAGVAPAYLADDCQLLSDVSRHTLLSSSNDSRLLVIPFIHSFIHSFHSLVY